MAKPITFGNIHTLIKGTENIKIFLKNEYARKMVYEGNSNKVPYWLSGMFSKYRDYVVENISTPCETVAKKKYMSEVEEDEKVIWITLKEKDYDVAFGALFYKFQPDETIEVVEDQNTYISQGPYRYKQLFYGKICELPKLLFDELENRPVLMNAPCSGENSATPVKYFIIL